MLSAYLNEIVINLIAVFIVFIARLFGLDVYGRLIRGFRGVLTAAIWLRGKPIILLYTDCDDELHTTRVLAARLREELTSAGIRARVEIAQDGVDLERWTFTRAVTSIVLLITDVTQLSARPRSREQLQKRLVKYVHRGGCLILGHDVIYRRSRNESLQKLAGCILDKFERSPEQISYRKVEAGPRVCSDSELLDRLPASMELSDGEVVIGSWSHDVEFLYCWDGNEDRPLVTRRRVEKGLVCWVNSGDSDMAGPPRVLARPEAGFVRLMSSLILSSAPHSPVSAQSAAAAPSAL